MGKRVGTKFGKGDREKLENEAWSVCIGKGGMVYDGKVTGKGGKWDREQLGKGYGTFGKEDRVQLHGRGGWKKGNGPIGTCREQGTVGKRDMTQQEKKAENAEVTVSKGGTRTVRGVGGLKWVQQVEGGIFMVGKGCK